ncbi:Acyl-CoA dehydrogenase [Dethiosulfatibacter aminovorans DSM 17477]|uniref:Acyl-CoA dehydrogenase n=1 Tax=Dethiosulfatibacter aminovorans DSM 17477 TaxID=1121476 RepID=A0A1M6MB17_9FIRM|nr:acyl-CoA dehydrogenase family protein [Dethiosulfatibacter aminovorans]SHJ80662.1 Acyl-CoA dehydrogenase [Dethiosulfatibacter aminovorans DSM 17477]
MEFMFNEEQKMLRDMVKEFGEKEIVPVMAGYDRTGELPMELYKKAMEMGLHALEIPVEYGGAGLDVLTACFIQEELAKYDAGFAAGLSATGLATKPVLIAGTEEQKKMFTDVIVSGGIAGFCLTEPEAGSDASAVKTNAVKEGEEYVINGSKCFITNGGIADIYTVIASTDKGKGVKGLSAFIVERNRTGISIGKEEDKMGIRLTNTTDVVFENVRIPESNLIGKEGDGFKIFMKTLDLSRPLVGACTVGICQTAINHCVKYSKERVTFGKPIAANQAIQFMLADMEIQTEAARQLVYSTASLIDAKQPHSKESAIVKCFATDIAMKVTIDAVQIFGGYGYSREYPVEKLMRDAKIFQIFEGTNQIQRMVVASNMLR